jgi:glycolate oxidase iron-sulfur subunit
MRVALLAGCAQRVLDPAINEATIRLLTRLGCEVVIPPGTGCCGALPHHMGKEEAALALARANLEAWGRELEGEGLDAVVINASGCGTTVKDYGFLFRLAPSPLKERAERLAALACDVSELLARLDYAPARSLPPLTVAYHAACSLQHGQRITDLPKTLLRKAGFTVREPREAHLCCGSAGTYNLLQPEISAQLRSRKLGRLAETGAAVIATGNIGCLTQLSGGGLPVVHTVELLDWAHGGPPPAALRAGGLEAHA